MGDNQLCSRNVPPQPTMQQPSLLWNSQRAGESSQSTRERSEKSFPLRSVETRLPKNSPTRCSGAEMSGFRGTNQALDHRQQLLGDVIILRLSGKLAQSCVSPTPEMPKSRVKHRHVATSCASANCSVSAGGIPRREHVVCGRAKQEEQPSILKVLDQRNPIEGNAVFLCGGLEFSLHMLLVANQDAQYTNPLL